MINQDQEIFNILLETVSEAVIIVNEDQQIMEINRVAEALFSYKRTELKGRSIEVLIPPDYHKVHSDHVKNFIKKNKQGTMAKTLEVFGRTKNGKTIPVEVELNPYQIYDKTYVMALIKDVSKQKESEFQYMLRSKALESASNGILITNALKPDNPIIYFNKAFTELTGYNEADIINKNCRFLQGADRDQEALNKLRQAIKEGKSCQVTLRNYRKDGTLFWNDLYITPIKNKRGVVTNFIGIQNDVTERVIAEEERNHLASILNESLNEIYVFDAQNLHYLNVNKGARQNTGYSMEELKTMTPVDLGIARTVSEFKHKFTDPLLGKKKERLEYETIQRRKNGSTYPVALHLQLSHLNQRPVFVAISVDITEHKNYQRQLEKKVDERTKQLQQALSQEKELNELKTKFLSLVSHEFKTPLSGISTSVMLLEKYKDSKDHEKRLRHLNIIRDKVHYLNGILNDFLSIERLDSGTVIYKKDHFKLSKVINEVVYNANMLLKEGQKINYPANINDVELHQDERIIELLLSNVVQNAVKYSQEHSLIDIRVLQSGDLITIEVEDQGIGIPEKDLNKVFNRYYRAENVVNMQGTGIGLNITKTHIENLGGSISLKSKLGKGTTVIMNIPKSTDG